MINYERQYYLDRLEASKNNGLIKILTGIRQCGKSYILMKFFEKLRAIHPTDQVIEYKLAGSDKKLISDENNLEINIRNRINDKDDFYIYIDEVQMYPDFVQMLISIKTDFPNVDFYVTGSNSKMLSSDIVRDLGTNGDEIKVFPLSLNEFENFCQLSGKIDLSGGIINKYYEFGGMPSVVLNPMGKNSAFKMIKETIIENDILSRHDDVDRKILDRLLRYISSTYGCSFSIQNIIDEFADNNISIKDEDISNYLSYLEDAFMIYPIYTISNGLDTLDQNEPKKYYVIDHSLANYIGETVYNTGYMIENIVYIDLLRRDILNISIGRKTDNSKEIDFTYKTESIRHLVQVTEKMPIGSKAEQREFDSFIGKTGSKLLITAEEYHGRRAEEFPDVKIVLLEDFLHGY